MKDQDLRELFLRFRDQGDMRALAKLFDAAAPQLVPVAVHLAARRDEADDLVQATFLSAIERAASYDESRPLLPWLLGILALHARKLREKHGRVLDVERVHQPAENDPERLAAAAEVKFAVEAACRELPDAYATIVRRHLVEGLEPVELGRELGLSNGAARVRLHRGLKLLRRALPAAFASGAYAATTTSSGIAAIRAVVLERGSLLTGSPVPAAGFAPIAIVVAFLVPFVVAVPAWFAWSMRRVSEVASESLAAMPAASVADPSTSVAPPTASERVVAASASGNSSSPGSSFGALTSNAIVRGRLVFADGAPAVDAMVALSGSQATELRAQEFGLPVEWHDPIAQHSSADGHFEFTFDPPRAYQFDMRVEHSVAATARWHWTELAPGSTLDLGDVVLERGAQLNVHIVDAQGHALCSGWTVRVEAPAPTAANGRAETRRHAECAASGGEFVLEHLPARLVGVEASCDAGVVLDKRSVELASDETTQLELVYAGPDLARRITVCVLTRFSPLSAETTQIRVSKPGMPPRLAVLAPHRASDYVVDDLDPGAYDVEITDARFDSWSKANVQPGEIVRAKLVGNAGVRLHIVGTDGSPYTGHFGVALRYVDVNFAPNNFTLLDVSNEPPQDGVFTGLIPHDLALSITPVGGPSQEVTVLGLASNETRDVNCVLGSGITLGGRVLAPDGTTPLAAVDVQLTRGEMAGHTQGLTTHMSRNGVNVPHVERRGTSDAQGHVSFDGIAAGRWTLRAVWGRYLNVDVTVDVEANGVPVDLVQPAHGFLVGHLLVPEGAPLADTRLVPVRAPGQEFLNGGHLSRDWSEVLGDGSFHIGPLPVGATTLDLEVLTPWPPGGFSSSGQYLSGYAIHAGEDTQAEIDLRETFPGRLRAHVVIDGVAASGGWIDCSNVSNLVRGGGQSVELGGVAYVGSLDPGIARVTYTSSDDTWSWVVPQQVTIEPGHDTPLEIALFNTARDLRCVDTANGAVLANVDVEWRTGGGSYQLVAHAKTDAQGLLHLKMPEQNVDVRCVGDTGAFTTIAWSAGSGPLTVALHHAP